MRLYILVTGSAFALLFVAHVARIALEGWRVAANPLFIIATLGSIAICTWAIHLYRNRRFGPVEPHQ